MNNNRATEEPKSRIDKKPLSNFTSATKLPLWLITSFVLLLASLVSLIYFFLKGLKARSRQANFGRSRTNETDQTEDKSIQAARFEHDKKRAEPVFEASIENPEQTEQSGNPIAKWLDSLNAWSFPTLTFEQVKKAAFLAAGPILALVIVYFAQSIFNATRGEGWLRNWIWLHNLSYSNQLWLGAGVFLISILIWVFTTPSMQSVGAVLNRFNPDNLRKPRYHPVRFLILFTSISIYLVSVFLFLMSGENGFIRGLWVAGLICFVISQVPWPGIQASSHPEAEESPRFQWQNWLVLALILGGSFWLRFYLLGTIPNNLHGDMASYGLVARAYLLGPDKNLFGYSGWYEVETMAVLPTIISMAIFGNNLFGLQMTAVLGGMFSLLAIYLLIWRLFNSHRLAVLTTILVSINIAHIHFSRIAAYMDPWLFGYFSLFFLIDGLKARRTASFGLAGVFLAFCLEMYSSGWTLIFIIGLFLIYVFFFQRSWIIQNKRGLVLMVIGVLIAMGPILVLDLQHWNSTISRSREVFIFAPGAIDHLLNKYHTNSPFIVLLNQIKLMMLMFNQTGDSSTQFGFPYPMFSSLVSPLILLGLGFSLRRWKDIGMVFVLIWLGVIAAMGGVLTLDAPFWPRLVGIVPAAALLIAVAFEQIFELGKKILGSPAVVYITALVVIFLITSGYLNWNQYYSFVKNNATSQVVIGRYINSLPNDVTACSLVNGPPLIVRETDFLAWPHKLVDIKPDAPDSDLDACTGSAIVWVISPENIGRLDSIRTRWPDGIVQTYDFPNYNYTLTFYLIGVLPPASPAGKTFIISPWLLYGIYIFIAVIVYSLLMWFFFQILLPEILQRRKAYKSSGFHIDQTTQKAPRQPNPSVSLKSMFTDGYASFDNWLDEISAFTFPTISPRVIVSTLLSLVAVLLAYFAQTFLDQQKSDGLHLSIKWLYLASEGQRLGIVSIIFLVAALIWTFTTTGRKKD